MNVRTLIFIYVVGQVSCLLTACGKDDYLQSAGTPIVLSASALTDQPYGTRASADIQTSHFEIGEPIDVYIQTSEDDPITIGNSPNEFVTKGLVSDDVNELSPVNLQPYYPNRDVTVDMYALYPATDKTRKIVRGEATTFSVEEDQTSDQDYVDSDLMYASVASQPRTSSPVLLNFSHKMAKVIVCVDKEESVEIESIELKNISRSVGFTPSTGVLADIAPEDQVESVKVDNNGAALLPPQTIDGEFLYVHTKQGTAIFKLTNKKIESGKAYRLEVYVHRENIGLTTSITDWLVEEGSISIVPHSNTSLQIGESECTYDGSPQEPKPLVQYVEGDETTDLTLGTHYRLQYFNNRNAGTGTIIFTGLTAPVTGVVAVKTFTIHKANVPLKYPDDKKTVTYQIDGSVDHALNMSDYDSTHGKMTYSSSNISVAEVDQTSGNVTIVGAGSATISASMAADGNYLASSADYALTVEPKSLNNADVEITISPTSFVYNGKPQEPVVEVYDKDRSGTKKKIVNTTAVTNYEVSVTGNTDVKDNIVVNILGRGNYKDTNSSKVFNITKATPDISMSDGTLVMAVGGKTLRSATADFGSVTLSSDNPNVATVNQAGQVTAVAEGTTTIRAVVEAGTNYNSAEKTYSVEVKDPNFSTASPGVYTWTCSVTGVYRLEVWGAEGAAAGSFVGGRGAYIAGKMSIDAGTVLHLYVGGAGALNGVGGTNGGGGLASGVSISASYLQAGGGGATDIMLDASKGAAPAWNTDTHWNNRIMVAGGGGGALYFPASNAYANGGEGGAYNGGNGGGAVYGRGGTQSAGGAAGGTNGNAGSKGCGGTYKGSGAVGMGGGGYYGGGCGGDNSTHGSGGGGSSYISSNITLITKEAGNHSGNGAVSITYSLTDN